MTSIEGRHKVLAPAGDDEGMDPLHPDLARLEAALPSAAAHAIGVAADPALVVLGTFTASGLLSEEPRRSLRWSALVLLLAAGLPYAVVALLVRAGHVNDMHVVVREQRAVPLAVAAAGSSLAIGSLRYGGAPREVTVLTTSLLTGLALMGAVSTRHKISFHVATATWSSAVLATRAGVPTASVTLPASVAVGWARHRGGRHSLGQVLAGGAIGALLGAGTARALRRPAVTGP